jgi:hypothetical protein
MIDKMSYLSKKADVIGTPRISITFDNDADTARFLRELNRDIDNTINLKYNRIGQYQEFTIYGVNVRIL